MFSDLVVLYLFLGGAGAGAIAVCCIADLALSRRLGAEPQPCAHAVERTIDLAFLAGFVMLTFAVVCLMADLGRLDRVANLLFSPHLTPLTVGAFSLAALLALGAVLAAMRLLYLPDVSRRAVRVAEGLAIAVALVVVVYTGVLLQGLTGVAFWRMPLLPLLFALSSASCGVAVVCAMAPFSGVEDVRQQQLLSTLARCDAVLIVLEAAVAGGLLWWAHGSENAGAQAAFEILTSGNAAASWWLGFMLCGLALPLAVEVALVLAQRPRRFAGTQGTALGTSFDMRKMLAIAAALVLLGALCMRWTVVEAGQHRQLELQPSLAAQLDEPTALTEGAGI